MHWFILSEKLLEPRWVYQIVGFWEEEADRLRGDDPIHVIDHKAGGLLEAWGKETRRMHATLARFEWKLEGRDVWKFRPENDVERAHKNFVQLDDVVERLLYSPAEQAALKTADMKGRIEGFIDSHLVEIRDAKVKRNVNADWENEVAVRELPDEVKNMPGKGNR